MTLPADSRWRHKSRLLAAIPILALLLGVTFILGAQVKNAAASSSGASSAGSRLLTADTAFKVTATRLQLDSSLDAAIELENDPNTRQALSWETQLHAAVPRVLWPGKPVVDYGQRVAVAVYDSDYHHTSSTVTTIGDSLINYGPVGLALIGIACGFCFQKVETGIQHRTSWISLLVGTVVIYSTIGQEEPIILILVGIVRNVLVVGTLWFGVTALSRWTVGPQAG